MVTTTMEFDRATSCMMMYHILCAPDEKTKRQNPDIFNNFTIPQEEQEKYLSYFKNHHPKKMENFRLNVLLKLKPNTLEEYLVTEEKNIPPDLIMNLRQFERQTTSYFLWIEELLKKEIPAYNKETQAIIDYIYDTAQKLSGITIERPEHIKIRIVEGLSPFWTGEKIINGKMYINMPPEGILAGDKEYYSDGIIHEAVGHQTARPSINHHKELFGQYVYLVEEGFVKLFTRKIAEDMFKKDSNYRSRGGLEEQSYNIFEKNWNQLDGTNFDSWYRNCLEEINTSSQLSERKS